MGNLADSVCAFESYIRSYDQYLAHFIKYWGVVRKAQVNTKMVKISELAGDRFYVDMCCRRYVIRLVVNEFSDEKTPITASINCYLTDPFDDKKLIEISQLRLDKAGSVSGLDPEIPSINIALCEGDTQDIFIYSLQNRSLFGPLTLNGPDSVSIC